MSEIMPDFLIQREMNIVELEHYTKKFIQVFIDTECHDCYLKCEKTNEDVSKCINTMLYDVLIVNKLNLENILE